MLNCKSIEEVKKYPLEDINIQDRYGQTLLHKAVVYNNIDFVKDLLSIDNINIRIKDINGQTPIFYVRKMKDRKKEINDPATNPMFKLFLDKGGPIILTDYNNKGENYLASLASYSSIS